MTDVISRSLFILGLMCCLQTNRTFADNVHALHLLLARVASPRNHRLLFWRLVSALTFAFIRTTRLIVTHNCKVWASFQHVWVDCCSYLSMDTTRCPSRFFLRRAHSNWQRGIDCTTNLPDTSWRNFPIDSCHCLNRLLRTLPRESIQLLNCIRLEVIVVHRLSHNVVIEQPFNFTCWTVCSSLLNT
jgi:hypothetical protein